MEPDPRLSGLHVAKVQGYIAVKQRRRGGTVQARDLKL